MNKEEEKKLNQKEAEEVSGGSHGHPGINHRNSSGRPVIDDEEDRNFPKVYECMECGSEFSIGNRFEYENLTNNYTGLYCTNCRSKHHK